MMSRQRQNQGFVFQRLDAQSCLPRCALIVTGMATGDLDQVEAGLALFGG